MPQFTVWNVPDPTPNVLYNQAAIDESIAKQQSELGTLDINRQRLGLEQRKLDLQQAGGQSLIDSLKGTTLPTDTTASGGGSFLGALADIESGDKNIVSTVDKDSKGLTVAQGGNPSEISQGHFQIQTATWRDFAKQAGVDVNQYPNAMSAPREVQAQVASVIPLSRFGPRTQTLLRSRFGPLDTNQTVGALAGTPALTFAPGTAGPRVATAPPPPFNPYAGPRVAGAPPAGAPDAAPVIAPAAPPQPGFGALTPVPGAPTVTGQADPASMEAVKKASIALLAMPEADAAVAYGPTVKALQAQGLAMNAPPVYPGHAALQAIVGQADAPVPVAPSPVALRTGGTDVAGPGAGPDTTLPPVAQPNRLYETGLPGIQIAGPGSNALAPPVAAAAVSAPPAPVTAPAGAGPPGGRPPILQPPAAPSRVIPLEPVLPNGLTASQVRLAGAMVQSGAPVADVAAHLEQWKQANRSGQQQAATQAALDAQATFERQKYYQQQQIETEKTQYQRQQDAQAAADKARADARAEQQLQLSREGGAREAAKAHEQTLEELAPKMAADSPTPATPAEKRRYAGSYYALQQTGVQATTMDDPNNPGQKIPAMITRRLPPQYPEPEGGALPLVMASPGAPTKATPTLEEGRSATFASRMAVAIPIMDRLDTSALTWGQKAAERAGNYIGYNLNSPDYQKLRTAQEAFLSAIIRDESGAAVGPDEWKRYAHMFFPMPGDDAEQIKLKQQFRQLSLESEARKAGAGFKLPTAGPAPGGSSSAAPASKPPPPGFKVIQ